MSSTGAHGCPDVDGSIRILRLSSTTLKSLTNKFMFNSHLQSIRCENQPVVQNRLPA
jgi:hypothetical protein